MANALLAPLEHAGDYEAALQARALTVTATSLKTMTSPGFKGAEEGRSGSFARSLSTVAGASSGFHLRSTLMIPVVKSSKGTVISASEGSAIVKSTRNSERSARTAMETTLLFLEGFPLSSFCIGVTVRCNLKNIAREARAVKAEKGGKHHFLRRARDAYALLHTTANMRIR